MFASLSDRLSETFRNLRGKGRLSEADIDETVREIRIALLDADVALQVVREFCAQVKERALSAEVSGALNPAQQVVKIVHEQLVQILGGETRRLRFAKQPPTVILLAGLQGAGKTTLAGKLAAHLRAQSRTPLLVAADLQRPNAVDQLRIVGERAGVPVFAPEPGNGVGDPVRVARDAVEHAKVHLNDIVIVDTAGRLAIDAELMDQLARVRDAVSPDETLLVVDAMIGQDAVRTAEEFGAGVGFDGVVLTKLDGDARGGAALSFKSVVGRPIKLMGIGEKPEDFEPFHPERMAQRILGMGDVVTLVEKAAAAVDMEEAARMEEKMRNGGFTLQDFLDQMRAMKKLGPLQDLVTLLPGGDQMVKGADLSKSEREFRRMEGILCSMTPKERATPQILNAKRRQRIAKGSGVNVAEVNNVLRRFEEMREMMRKMGKFQKMMSKFGGKMPGGMPGMGGFRGM